MSGPLRHVCLFRLKRSLSAEETAELQRHAAAFLAADANIRAYRFGQNTSRKAGGFELVLYSEFTSAAALAAYVQTPQHEVLAAFMDAFVDQTVVADVAMG